MVVDADVRHVTGHDFDGVSTCQFQESRIVGSIKLKQCRTKLKTLGPLGPTAGSVFALECENRRAAGWVPALLKGQNFAAGEFEHPTDLGKQVLSGEFAIDL